MEKLKEFANTNISLYGFGGVEDEMSMIEFVDTEISLICLQFKRPPYFDMVIKDAIVYGIASGGSLKSTSAEVIESNNAFPTTSYFKLPQVVINVSPTSTYDDVKSAIRDAKELYKTDERLIYYQPRVDVAPNIRKYREWYWQRIAGKTYQAIADEWIEKYENENTTYLDVLKAVKTYEKLLTT